MTSFAAPGFRDARTAVDRVIREALIRLDATNSLIASYHLGYVEADGTPTGQGSGKGVRGILAVLSARAVSGNESAGAVTGAAVELIHNYSLLHDDIIDGDRTRRHRPSAWTVYGGSAAILAGDAMAALALEIVTAAHVPNPVGSTGALAAATRAMLAGQSADIAFEQAAEVSVAACQAMVRDKTGALLACAASIGAVAAGASDAVVACLSDYGYHLGMAFQLVDDLLGIWGTAERTGKPVASDLASRKKSLPVVAALAAGGPDSDRLRALYAHEGTLTIDDLAAAAAAVDGAGGRAWAQAQAKSETAAALAALDAAEINQGVRDELRLLTEALCARDW